MVICDWWSKFDYQYLQRHDYSLNSWRHLLSQLCSVVIGYSAQNCKMNPIGQRRLVASPQKGNDPIKSYILEALSTQKRHKWDFCSWCSWPEQYEDQYSKHFPEAEVATIKKILQRATTQIYPKKKFLPFTLTTPAFLFHCIKTSKKNKDLQLNCRC